MQGIRAWAFCISFPDTLYLLNEAIKNRHYVSLDEKYDDILKNTWLVPEQAQKGDYIIHIITPGNTECITRLADELYSHPDEWLPEEFDVLSAVLEEAKEAYSYYDGKLFCITPIEEIEETENNSQHYALFHQIMISCDETCCYDNTIIGASRGMTCLLLTRNQTLEIIKTGYVKDKENEILFSLNADIEEPLVEDYDNQVQAFVVNNVFPDSLYEIIQDIEYRGFLTIEVLFQEQEAEWTVPRWCKSGDIAFLMFSKTSNARISALVTEFNNTKENYSIRERRILEETLSHGRHLYKKYGGCIFGFARVEGRIVYEKQESDSKSHWRSPIYALMNHITVLEKPIPIEEFREFLTIARHNTITPVLGEAFDKLKDLIISNNDVPDFFKYLEATPVPLTEINKDNWIIYGMKYRRHFFLEEAFRMYYVDYLLKYLGDKKTFYRECKCYKSRGNPPRVDNIIVFNGKYLPVEIKLSIHNEADIEGQVKQYCGLSKVVLEKEKNIENPLNQMYSTNVLIIDTEDIYLYDDKTNTILKIYNLDRITELKEIQNLRKTISELLV